MRHRRSTLRLPQKPSHAAMMVRNLATSLLLYERIRTTHKRALVVRPMVEKLLRTAREKEPREAIRAMNRVVTHRNASRKLIEVFRAAAAGSTGGFVSMRPIGARKGDGAALVELRLRSGVPPPPSSST